jgi:hypothetical protein
VTWGNAFVITIQCTLRGKSPKVGLEAANDPGIHGLNMRGEVWGEIFYTHICERFGGFVTTEIVLKEKNVPFFGQGLSTIRDTAWLSSKFSHCFDREIPAEHPFSA